MLLETVSRPEAARRARGVARAAVTAAEGDTVRPAGNAHGRIGHVIAAGARADEVAETPDTAHREPRVRTTDETTVGDQTS